MATRILDAEARITARDLTGGTFEGVASKIARVNRAAQSLARDLDRHMAAAGRASFVDRLSTRLDSFGDAANKFGRRMTYGVTLPAALAARSVYHNVHDFELAANKLKAFGGLTEEQLKSARDLAKKYGSDYAFGPTGVMQGMVEQIKAGFEPRHLAAIQQPLLDFATLGEIDIPKASELAIFALSGFGKMYDATGKMLDDATINKNLREMIDLFAVLNKVAPGSIGQISETFKYSAAAASKLGVSPEQLGAFTAVLNQAGIIGPEAGVALRSMMVRFLKPTRPALAAMNAVGMKLDDYIKIDPSRLKPEAILSAVENYTGTIGTGKKKRKFGVGKAPDAKREEFLRKIAKLEGLQGEDYVKGLTGVLRNTVGGGMQDAKVAGDLAQRIVGTAVEKIDVMKFLKDVSAKAPNMAAFMANFMDQRQAVRLANLDQARVNTMMVEFEKVIASARARGASESGEQAGTINSGIIEAENKLRGSYQNLIQSVAQSGVSDAAVTAMDNVAKGLKAIGDTNPKILEWSTYAIAAAAAIGPLAFVLGNLAKAAAALRYLVPLAAVPGAPVAAAAVAGAALGKVAIDAATPLADAAKGKNWTPHDLDSIIALEKEAADAEQRAKDIRARSRSPEAADLLAGPLERRALDARNRAEAGRNGPSIAPKTFDRLTVDSVQTSLRGASESNAPRRPNVAAREPVPAAGKKWPAHDLYSILSLENEAAEAEQRAKDMRARSRSPETADLMAGPLERRAADARNRAEAGWNGPSIAPEKLERLTVDSIQSALRGERAIEGRVQVDVTTKVEPSPDFISRAISTVKSLWSGNITGSASSSGTTGSTGTSMPEAMPGVP